MIYKPGNNLSDFVNKYAHKFHHLYYSTMEKFLTSLGATIENIKEWEIQQPAGWPQPDEKYICRNGERIGKISISTESGLTGYRIVLECVDLRLTNLKKRI